MGLPTVDLPDPTDAPPDEAAASADDLLSQLAGEEIDRLLAEADSGEPMTTRQPAAREPNDPPVTATARMIHESAVESAAIDSSIVDLPIDEPITVDPPKVHPQGGEIAPLSPAAHKLPAYSVAAGRQPTASPAEARHIDASIETTSTAPDVAAEPPSAADALREELDNDETDVNHTDASLPDVLDEVLSAGPTVEASVPLLLRPLEWLNRPFAFISNQTRTRLGKVGLITLANALVILAYVLFFRTQ